MSRVVFSLLVTALVGIVLIAWTAIPDCWQPGVCG